MFKNRISITKNRNVLSISMSLIIFWIIFLISISNFLYIFDKKIQDLYFLFNDTNINKDIIVVEIDEDTLSWRKNVNWEVIVEWLWRFPFDRRYYATVIDNLNNAWASVVALDIIFWEKSDTESDDILSNSMKNAWNVILWLWPNSSWVLQYPYEKFRKYIFTSGYYAPNIDKTTNVVYSIKPYSQFRWIDEIYEHFSISIIRWFYAKIYDNDDYLSSKRIFKDDNILISDKIELTRSRELQNEVLINYNNSYKFTKKSFLDIYNNQFDPELVKDKIILIWATAKWIKDVFNTPLWTEYWVYVHANMINTILTKNGIKYFNKTLEWFLIFLLIIVSVYFNFSKSSYILVLSNIALTSIFILWVLYITLLTTALLNYPIELFIALILSLTVSNVAKYLIENKHKTRLNKALSEYVSEDVAHEILSGDWRVNLDWENKDIWIFFSDIEWFTSISEQFSPELLVSFLREYLSEMSNIIMDEKWFINKYEWDAIIALWWVFWKDSMESYQICLSSLEQQKRLKELNIEWWKRWFAEIKTRIWIHYWHAIIWNIWAEWRKMEFTALWDNVNLASRLEWVNKFYWTNICASEDIYKLEKEHFEFRYLDKIRVKWKENSIDIYELIALKWELSNKQKDLYLQFEEAIELYKDMKFEEAWKVFTLLSKWWDNPSTTYKQRCEVFQKKSPKADWDRIWVMEDK